MATGGGSRTPLWLTVEVEDRENWLWQVASESKSAGAGAAPFSVVGEEWASSPSAGQHFVLEFSLEKCGNLPLISAFVCINLLKSCSK